MNAIARKLNEILIEENVHVYEMLSNLGKNLYFPRGILFQGAEAKEKANKLNATIGIATENGIPIHLQDVLKYFNDLSPHELFNYAPASGKSRLRKLWREKMIEDNPSLHDKKFSLPVVTNAITHGLSISADMLIDQDDTVFIPDKFWGNYKLIFGVRRGARLIYYPFIKDDGFNVEGLHELIKGDKNDKKAVVILNFPNNPTGYSITKKEGQEIISMLNDIANLGKNLVIINDDAYFGLFYTQNTLKESLFSHIININEKILAIKLDAVTKEEFMWGFRIGFITFGSENLSEKAYNSLEQKVMGIIRCTISNCSMPAQSIIERLISNSSYRNEQYEKFELLKHRYEKVSEILKNQKYNDEWSPYPFNSGYFMCLKLKNVNAEALRRKLLDEHGVGAIATNEMDIRVAFSCVDLELLEKIFDIIYNCIKDLRKN